MNDDKTPPRDADAGTPEVSGSETPAGDAGGMDRRSFLRRTGMGAGALAVAGSLGGTLAACRDGANLPGTGPEVAVVGAGAFGVWTAYHLQEMGARVTLIDLYGPGNSRSTSGDETRGIRSSYQGRELWTSWAQRAIERWEAFDEEWSPRMGAPVFYRTGDVILRDSPEGMIEGVEEVWNATGREYERIGVDEVRRRWPWIDVEGMEVALYEPGAGVARSRAACQRVAAVFQNRGGEIRIGRATTGPSSGGRMSALDIDAGDHQIGADRFVFALGPWFPTAFPEIMGERIRIPMGHVFYFGTPPGDHRFNYPNMPSWNVPGVTGWPSLPPDHRGFRVRTGGQAGEDPDTSVRWIPEEFHERARNLLRERFPDLADQPLVETRACHYESSTTRDWIVDRHPELENVWFAGAGNAEGFKFGPVVGELVACRVLENGRFAELDERFRLDPPEQTTDEAAG